LGAATAAVTDRFGVFGVVGPVTAWQVAAACSGVLDSLCEQGGLTEWRA
jgi:hypothetical protein